MKENKSKIILLVIIIVIIIFVIIMFTGSKEGNISIPGFTKKEKTESFCSDITNLQKDKKDFIVYVGKPEEETTDNEIINKIKAEYKNLNIVEIENSKQSTSCMKNILKKASLVPTTNQDFDYIIVYKSGEYIGLYSGIDTYYSVAKYISDRGLIDKPIVNETTTLKQFNTKIQNNYLLFLVSTDEHVKAINNYANKYFANISYNLVDVTLPDGSKIYNKVMKEYNIENIIPQAIYFKNSKKIISIDISDDESEYIQLKQIIEKNN